MIIVLFKQKFDSTKPIYIDSRNLSVHKTAQSHLGQIHWSRMQNTTRTYMPKNLAKVLNKNKCQKDGTTWSN